MGISYHAFVIDEKDRANKLCKLVVDNWEQTQAWETIAHHVTVGMGPTPNNLLPDLGKQFDITLTHIGLINGRVLAVKVIVKGFDQFASSIAFPHITLAINRADGAKPYDSNKITDWTQLKEKILVKGTLCNLDNNSKIVK